MDRLLPSTPIATKDIEPDHRQWLSAQVWWEHRNIQSPDRYLNEMANPAKNKILTEHWEKFFELHQLLLSIGGHETCFPAIEEDMQAILERGRFYPGRSKMMVGLHNQCHGNVCNLWQANKRGFNVSIATGYALSPDGLWRQHSWLVHRYQTKTQSRLRIIETTVKRCAYFGFEMTDAEAEDFCCHNPY